MIISFRSKELRDDAINEVLGTQSLSPRIFNWLKAILTSLNAASNINDLPSAIRNRFKFHNENIVLVGYYNLDLHFKTAHLNTPTANDGTIDWQKVYRLQLIRIGEIHVG
ncbi:hypothetical protein F966_01383 [Acinetobacter higginsii]|uniref:Uncharacterized protein n=1 Tax=Acinetobacter higginsii TaxID=70347 RepID=N8XSZ3_9GAMM|nr:hypothetical protein [Acinetobacter higginsii]ENV10210.1 hypothetical protein F966_01383 [Acinetobacter higginsii]